MPAAKPVRPFRHIPVKPPGGLKVKGESPEAAATPQAARLVEVIRKMRIGMYSHKLAALPQPFLHHLLGIQG